MQYEVRIQHTDAEARSNLQLRTGACATICINEHHRHEQTL
jgi:hypothetical protein